MIRSKKAISLILLCALVCAVGLCAACAKKETPAATGDRELLLEADAANALQAGDEVTVTVRLKNVLRLESTDIDLQFDPAVLTVSDEQDDKNGDIYFNFAPAGDGVLRCAAFVLENIDMEDSELLTVRFTVNEGVDAAETALTASVVDLRVSAQEEGQPSQDVAEELSAAELTLTLEQG